jgi:prepilin-type N-terminal cleavage/methylation domain-containing protein
MKMLNTQGFSMIESLAAAAVLGIFLMASSYMYVQAKSYLNDLIQNRSIKGESDYVVESVRDLANLTQINFDPNNLPTFLDPDKLPLVFDQSFSGTIPQCLTKFSIPVPANCLTNISSCSLLCPIKGRYGFSITPFVTGYETPETAVARGIYRVNLLIRHPSINSTGNIEEHVFVIGAK